MSDLESVLSHVEEYDDVWEKFPHFPMTHQDIFNMASKRHFYLDDGRFYHSSDKNMIEARKYIREQFTGKSDPSFSSKKKH